MILSTDTELRFWKIPLSQKDADQGLEDPVWLTEMHYIHMQYDAYIVIIFVYSL